MKALVIVPNKPWSLCLLQTLVINITCMIYGFLDGWYLLSDYIGVHASKHATYVPHTAGRYSVKRFRKAQCPTVERLSNLLMMHGRNNGKKLMAIRIIKHAKQIIYLLTVENSIQVIVDAIVLSMSLTTFLNYGSFHHLML